MGTGMATTTDPMLPSLRLMHLVSPSLPVGAFAYSQGLEWAVECDWVTDEASLSQWAGNLLETSLTNLEIPILARMYQAVSEDDHEMYCYWSEYLIASRETRELRSEERNRARAMTCLLPELGVPVPANMLHALNDSQVAGFSIAASYWQVPVEDAAAGYLWGWLENIVLAGVKIIPLGQSAGQRVLTELTALIPACVENGLAVADEDIGASSPAQAIASCRHETQYTRIYRS